MKLAVKSITQREKKRNWLLYLNNKRGDSNFLACLNLTKLATTIKEIIVKGMDDNT